MPQPIKDPGLGSKFRPGAKRLMNKDGTFNVRKTGARSNIRDTYQWLIKMTWSKFFALTFVFIMVVNLLFAFTYVLIGIDHLSGVKPGEFTHNLIQAFFFSFQTFTTLGYGHIAPVGQLSNFIAILEASTGLMVFAIITGLLYGRFAKPSMRILYSENALIAPYHDGWALMFRVVNLRNSTLLDLGASVFLTMYVKENNKYKRRYYRLKLEISKIEFFPATWTVVHPIDDKSPFKQLDLHHLEDEDIEVIIQLTAFDDTFSQQVHSRHSYLSNEIVVGARFKPAGKIDPHGDLVIPLHAFHAYEEVAYR